MIPVPNVAASVSGAGSPRVAPASAEAVFGVAPWAPPGVAPVPGNEFLVWPLFLASQFRTRFLAWLLLVWPVLLARLLLVSPKFLE